MSGPERLLMRDNIQTLDPAGIPIVIDGLQNGHYLVYSYSWGLCHANQTRLTVQGSPDGPQFCYSNTTWPGQQVHERTWVRHRVEVTQGMIEFDAAWSGGTSGNAFAVLNGMQLVFLGQQPIIGQDFCHGGFPNSAGTVGLLTAMGSDSVAANSLRLVASALPPNEFGALIASQITVTPTFTGGIGLRCLGGTLAIFRAQIQGTGAQGSFEVPVDLTNIPLGAGYSVLAGETWGFQAVYRDVNSIQALNLTSGVLLTFQ